SPALPMRRSVPAGAARVTSSRRSSAGRCRNWPSMAKRSRISPASLPNALCPAMPVRTGRGILERLEAGVVLGAEGYVFELERRGYIKAGPYVPEVVLDFPDAVRELHREFL